VQLVSRILASFKLYRIQVQAARRLNGLLSEEFFQKVINPLALSKHVDVPQLLDKMNIT